MAAGPSSTAGRRPRYDSMRSSTSDVGWRPPSPSFSTTTTGSRVNAPAGFPIISRKDLRQSIACFEELMAAAKAYRNALLAMSQATAAFAQAMEACSRVKGCRSANSALAGGSGLQHLLANHDQLLADTVYRQFEIPLLSALDHYKLITADRLASYEKRLSEQSAKIRKTEHENLRTGRRRKRDLDGFRAALAELQRQVEELDGVKMGYHEEVLEGEDEIWDTVLSKVAFVVRSQLDFYEKIAGKASDPILEPLVMSIPDPFDSYGPPKEDGQIFSVLAPLGMLDASPQSPTPALTRTHTSPSSSGRASPSKISGLTSTLPMSLGIGGGSGGGVPFPSMTMTPNHKRAESTTATSAISALGISSPEQEGKGEGMSRARRELSVIDERSGDGNGPVIAGLTDAPGQAGQDGNADADGTPESDAADQTQVDEGSDGGGDVVGDDQGESPVGTDTATATSGKDDLKGNPVEVPLPHSRQESAVSDSTTSVAPLVEAAR